MRVDKDGPLVGHVEVFLDGHRLPYCVMADEELGEAVCLVTSGSRILLDEHNEPLRLKFTGRVEVRPLAQPWGAR